MFASFNTEFNSNKKNTIPKPLVDYLSGKLPEGLHYVKMKDNYYCISADNGEMTFSDLVPVITEDIKNALGDNISLKTLSEYAYNSQECIRFEGKKKGYITVNNNEIPQDKVFVDMHSDVSFSDGVFILKTSKMEEIISVVIGNETTKKTISLRRLPDKSLSNRRYVSVENIPLSLEFYFDADNHQLKFNLSYKLKSLQSVDQVVEVLDIYYSFINGKGYINNVPMSGISIDTTNHINDELLYLWKRIQSVESALNIKFDVSDKYLDGYLTEDKIDDIELLYASIVEKRPLRENKRLNSINGVYEEGQTVIDAKQGELMTLSLEMGFVFDLFNHRFTLPGVVLVFNTQYLRCDIKDGEYTVYFDDKNEKEQMYYSVMCFKDINSKEDYMKNTTNFTEIFKKAQPHNIVLVK